MSLARQFGLEAPPRDLPTRPNSSTPFTSLAVSIKNKVQSQTVQAAVIDMSTSRNRIAKLDTDLKQGYDGSLNFNVYIDTENAMKVCRKSLVDKGFHFAKLGDLKLLIVPRDQHSSAQIGFELSIESTNDSACTSKITFSAPQTYVALSVKDAMEWATRLKDLHHSIVFGCR